MVLIFTNKIQSLVSLASLYTRLGGFSAMADLLLNYSSLRISHIVKFSRVNPFCGEKVLYKWTYGAENC